MNIAKKIEEYAILPENMEEYDYDLITINLNGFEMEIGKCFELLLYANNIEFDLVANGRDRRKNTSYIDIKDNNYEYVINTNNLYSINKPQKRWLIDPDIWNYIDNPVGTELIRISSNEFEVDKRDKEIFMEKRKA